MQTCWRCWNNRKGSSTPIRTSSFTSKMSVIRHSAQRMLHMMGVCVGGRGALCLLRQAGVTGASLGLMLDERWTPDDASVHMFDRKLSTIEVCAIKFWVNKIRDTGQVGTHTHTHTHTHNRHRDGRRLSISIGSLPSRSWCTPPAHSHPSHPSHLPTPASGLRQTDT